jgi:predicted DNA-binding protein
MRCIAYEHVRRMDKTVVFRAPSEIIELIDELSQIQGTNRSIFIRNAIRTELFRFAKDEGDTGEHS